MGVQQPEWWLGFLIELEVVTSKHCKLYAFSSSLSSPFVNYHLLPVLSGTFFNSFCAQMSNIMFVSLGIHKLNLADAGSLAWYATDWLWVHGSLINRLIIRTVFLFRLQYPHTVCWLLFGFVNLQIVCLTCDCKPGCSWQILCSNGVKNGSYLGENWDHSEFFAYLHYVLCPLSDK